MELSVINIVLYKNLKKLYNAKKDINFEKWRFCVLTKIEGVE